MAAAFQVHLASFYLKSQLQSPEREQAQHRIAPPRRSAQRLPPFRRVKCFSRLLLLFLTHVSFGLANLISRQPFLVAATHTPFWLVHQTALCSSLNLLTAPFLQFKRSVPGCNDSFEASSCAFN